MVPDSGELLIRDADEAFLLASPTAVSGTIDDDTGVVTGLDLTTPQISFEQPVEGTSLVAFVDASFSQVSPGSGSGTLGPDGSLTLSSSLRVDLHVEVPGAGLTGDCVTTPVALEFTSTSPYSEDTDRVTVRDANFTIPAVPVTTACDNTVASGINNALAGSGHSLEMTLEGDMTIPIIGTEDSDTTLAVTPSGTASLGQEVTLTATVAPGATDETTTPTGLVEFRDGGELIGRSALDGAGVASLSTTTLGLGAHALTAEYDGDSIYLDSTSEQVSLTVAARPTVTADLPHRFLVGSPPAELDLVTENPALGSTVANARIDVTISRYSTNGFSFDPLQPDQVVLEVETSPGMWTPVTLTQVSGTTTPTLTGSLPPSMGRPLAPGATFTDRVRLAFPDRTPQTIPGPLDVELTVASVDPISGVASGELSSTTGRVGLFLPGRVATQIDLSEFGEPYGPAAIRQGGTMAFSSVAVSPYFGGARATGTFTILIDGRQVPAFDVNTGDLSKPTPELVPLADGCACNTLFVDMPMDVGIGAHHLTIVYSGDDQFAPSETTVPFSVVASPVSAPYRCEVDQFGFLERFNVQLRTHARVPRSAPQGSTLRLDDYSFEIVANRNDVEFNTFDLFVGGTVAFFEGLAIDLGPGGSGSATAGALDPQFFPGAPEDLDDPDFAVTFADEEASLSVTGEPGSVITPSIEGFTLSADFFGTPLAMTCAPIGDPLTYGSITVAGTVLTVDGPTPLRADDELDLTAAVFPTMATGTVEFYDGDTLVDIAPVRDGLATTSVSLPVGAHTLTARFRAGISAPSTTSEVVVVSVLPATECAAFADDGNGAVVRLVFLELLGRCPDQGGYDYWVGRLDGGTSREAFARSIARTPEAVGRVVDDAYQAMLGRAADPAGRAFWTGRLQGSGRYDSLLADLAASGEFWSKSGATNAGVVTRVYERLLDRSPDQGGLDFWAGRLDGGTPRRALVVALANQSEPLGALVDDAYDEILDRKPIAPERREGIAFLRSTGDRSGLYARLIGTQEFQDRAQGLPNPED